MTAHASRSGQYTIMSQSIMLILVVCYNCVVIGMGLLGYLVIVSVKVSNMNESLQWFRNFDLLLH